MRSMRNERPALGDSGWSPIPIRPRCCFVVMIAESCLTVSGYWQNERRSVRHEAWSDAGCASPLRSASRTSCGNLSKDRFLLSGQLDSERCSSITAKRCCRSSHPLARDTVMRSLLCARAWNLRGWRGALN